MKLAHMNMIWECPMVYPFWCEVLEHLEKWVGFTIPPQPQLCLLGDNTGLPVNKYGFNVIKVCLVTAARILLRNWKVPRTPTLKEWEEEICEISTYEYAV